MNKKQLLGVLSWGWAVIVALYFIVQGVGNLGKQDFGAAITSMLIIPAFILVGNYIVLKIWEKKHKA